MIALARDLNFFAPRIPAGLSAIPLTGFHVTRAWDMRTLALFLSFHLRFLLFRIQLRMSRAVTYSCVTIHACGSPNTGGT